MNGLALCAGVGGLELGLRLALGEQYRTVGYCERDAYAAAILVARMEDEALDQAPVWDDLATFPNAPYTGGWVDIVSAGFPCQPFSVAGDQRGVKDERWLWPLIARQLRYIRPRMVFLENVPALLAHGSGFGDVLGDLAELGYDAEWDVFSACQVGAPHVRRRLFILAHPSREGWNRRWPNDAAEGPPIVPQARQPSGLRPSSAWVQISAPEPFGVADGVPARVDRLRCLGNGVVPLVAAVAFRVLAQRAGI